MLAPLQYVRWIAAVALLASVGCSYPHVYCAPDNCGPCHPQLPGNTPCVDCGPSCSTSSGKPSRGLFTHLGHMASCGGGCGEVYIHPWINDPPDCCDPCDCHGNWTGPQACCNRGFWASFWGNECGNSSCGSCTASTGCGCDSCSGEGPMVYSNHGSIPSGEVVPRAQEEIPQPRSAALPVAGSPTRAASHTPTKAIGAGVNHR